MSRVLLGLDFLAAYPLYLIRALREFAHTVRRFYRNPRLRRADLACMRAYFLRDADRMCRDHASALQDDRAQKIYGETFFSTLETLARAVQLTDKDVVYDLGSGRGRAVFWFGAMFGCRAVGVEINPAFVIAARTIAKRAGLPRVDFVLGNVLDLDYDEATVVYLYGTAFSDRAIAALATRLQTLRKGARVVSVSYPLTAYAGSAFELQQTLRAKYPWGWTDIYIQRRL